MIKKTVASIALGGTLLLGGAAFAAGTAGASTPTTPSPSSSTATPGAHSWVKAHRHALVRDAVVLTAKDIGVTPQDLVSELKSGKSLADVAGEHNVSSQTLVNDLVTAAEAKVNAAVSANKITSAEASKINAALPARVTTLVNHTFK